MKRVLCLLALLLPSVALAQGDDGRLLTLPYDPDGVVTLEGCLNFQTMIGFAPGETIQNVGLGDSTQWQVTPNKKGDLLFVKPLTAKAFSNMSIVTDKRAYNFELRMAPAAACAEGRVIYTLRFSYPTEHTGTPVNPAPAPDPAAQLPPVEKRNTSYTYSGAADLVPVRAFDDGISTYLMWPKDVTAPAVYSLNPDNSESIVNYATRGDYFVIEQVARAFVLRRGDEKAVLYNDAYVVRGLDADSPKLRAKSQGVIK